MNPQVPSAPAPQPQLAKGTGIYQGGKEWTPKVASKINKQLTHTKESVMSTKEAQMKAAFNEAFIEEFEKRAAEADGTAGEEKQKSNTGRNALLAALGLGGASALAYGASTGKLGARARAAAGKVTDLGGKAVGKVKGMATEAWNGFTGKTENEALKQQFQQLLSEEQYASAEQLAAIMEQMEGMRGATAVQIAAMKAFLDTQTKGLEAKTRKALAAAKRRGILEGKGVVKNDTDVWNRAVTGNRDMGARAGMDDRVGTNLYKQLIHGAKAPGKLQVPDPISGEMKTPSDPLQW
ncbi:MAG: hypothetical protein D4S01_03180 [Dehalococcoidia bacterium]|nr:MAG: hypothetical protein D4S01_03180 [Dehalococcoidia bacterium]